MGTKAIHCMVDGNIQGYYWYKGSTSSTQPILRLENGVKGGEKYDDDHYDITSDGNMKIINAMLEHEATYTFAVFFENGTTWSRSISVVISGENLTIGQGCSLFVVTFLNFGLIKHWSGYYICKSLGTALEAHGVPCF